MWRLEAELESLEDGRVDRADRTTVEFAVAGERQDVASGERRTGYEEGRDEHFCLCLAFSSNEGAVE